MNATTVAVDLAKTGPTHDQGRAFASLSELLGTLADQIIAVA